MAESRQAKSVCLRFLSTELLLLFMVLFSMVVLGPGPQALAASELDDFSDSIKKKQEQDQSGSSGGKKSSEGDRNGSKDSSTSGEPDDACLKAMAGLFFTLWADVNSRVRYDDYPYAHEDRSWVLYPDRLFNSIRQKTGATSDKKEKKLSPRQKRYNQASPFFINTAVGGSYMDAETRAFWLEWRSRVGGVLGLRGDWRRYFDSDSYIDHGALGGEVPIFQYGNVMLNFFVLWGSFRGDVYLDGTIVGGSMQLFPLKPVTLEFALSQEYYGTVEFTHLRGLLGFMIGRGELFVGYDYLAGGSAVLDGWDMGLRFWW